MISNFSEVEKSLKRCLKEKVSITAATVVGFLIAGTVAFGDAQNVEFTINSDPKVTIKVGSGGANPINGTTDSISVAQYEELASNGALKNLLTVTTNESGETVFAGVPNELGKVTATATNDGEITLLKTDSDHSSIASSLTIEAVGVSGYIATAMEAAGEGDTVTNDGEITAKDYAVGMKANAGATAVNNAEKTITVNGTDAVGMSAATAAGKTTTLTNNGTIAVTDGVGIEVKGAGKVNVEAGKITVADGKTGIKVEGTGTTTITGGNIEIEGTGKGIDAVGNVTLEDIAITLNGAGTGIDYTGGTAGAVTASISTSDINVQTGKGIKATLSDQADSKLTIETGILSTAASKTGIEITGTAATAPQSGKQMTAATVKTTLGATAGTGVTVAGENNNNITVNLNDSLAKDSSKVVVDGIGVDITSGGANGTTTVNINQSNLQVADGKKLVNVANSTDGEVNINVNKSVDLLSGANLVNIGTIDGNVNVALNADGQKVVDGSLVDVGAITAGTATVNINKNVDITGTGNIVKAGNITAGHLNVNLNVEGVDGLTVKTGKTALDLSSVNADNVASVKNTGTVTIAGTGKLVKGSDNKDISLTNQGLITLKAVDTVTPSNSSHISSGKKVNVANYGTIDLAISSGDFLREAGASSLEDLTLDQVKTALKNMHVIDSGSTGTFSSVGYIKFSDGKYFTAAAALEGSHSIEDLSTALTQQSEAERAFSVKDSEILALIAENPADKLSNVQLNLAGTLATATYGTNDVTIDNSSSDRIINITESGKVNVTDAKTLNYSGNITAANGASSTSAAIVVDGTGTLKLSNGEMNMQAPETTTYTAPADRVGIKLEGNGTLDFDNYTVNADIKGEVNSNRLQGTLNAKGNSKINGTVTDIKDIEITDEGMLTFGVDSVIVSTAMDETTINIANGNMGVEIGENGKNVLLNTDTAHLQISGGDRGNAPQDSKVGKVVLLTNTLTENTAFNLGEHGLYEGTVVANGDIYYNVVKGADGIWNAQFNKNGLLDENGLKYAELNNMYIATQSIHDILSKDIDLRAVQLDDLYSNNIYSETVKMSLDTLKMNEDAVLSLNVRPRQGEFTAQGKFLFNNTDYDREGTLRDYKVETKNTGLLGAMEYGLTDTSSVGFAFSGTKQDLDMKNGASADGDAFYFGLYRNDKFNNIDLTTGLGYMVDRVDAENFIGKDKFDSTALSGYVQGKYNYALGESLTLSPKARLTVTRFQQDSINNGRMKQEEVKDTMADVELGVEIKKGITLETGKMHLLAGASFTTNVAEKDDDYYKVNFISRAGNDGSTAKVKGANLEKNSLKLNIGADVELTNGVFYNGGLSYEFDDEDRDSIGVTLGAGYKF
ncbi:autotransporter domain-containing protein [uncultured Fusobacterium sp.]|uniref:autotransporter domain-containing protein n=1 Tax=uncultured Fusobacterium sp. TaxID=159267 RepID=UPI0025F586C0|nr:autotransporter domain-containing protein [uncultured Fusobacterium sp.]